MENIIRKYGDCVYYVEQKADYGMHLIDKIQKQNSLRIKNTGRSAAEAVLQNKPYFLQ